MTVYPRIAIRENFDELPPDVKPGQIIEIDMLRHDARNITVVNIHELHGDLPAVIESASGEFASPLKQQNFVARAYNQILEWMLTDPAAPQRFLGLIEVSARGRLVFGGAPVAPLVQESIGTLDIGFECMIAMADKLIAAGREALPVRTDIRSAAEDSWGRALFEFALLWQNPSILATNPDACTASRTTLFNNVQDVVDTVVYNRPARGEVDEWSLDFASRASRFMRRNMTELLPNRGLSDMIHEPELKALLAEMRSLLTRGLAFRAAQIVSRITADCESVENDDLIVMRLLASLTARVMDLALLQWIAYCPDNTTIVVHSGAAHASAVSTVLQLLQGFTLVSFGRPVQANTGAKDYLLTVPPFTDADTLFRVKFVVAADSVAAVVARARAGDADAIKFVDRLRARIVLMHDFSDVWQWIDEQIQTVGRSALTRAA